MIDFAYNKTWTEIEEMLEQAEAEKNTEVVFCPGTTKTYASASVGVDDVARRHRHLPRA